MYFPLKPFCIPFKWSKTIDVKTEKNTQYSIDNSHYRLILKLGKEMRINHHS